MLAPSEIVIIVCGWLLIVRLAIEFIIMIQGRAELILICFWNCFVDQSLISISLLEYIYFHQASPHCDVVCMHLPPLHTAQQHTV